MPAVGMQGSLLKGGPKVLKGGEAAVIVKNGKLLSSGHMEAEEIKSSESSSKVIGLKLKPQALPIEVNLMCQQNVFDFQKSTANWNADS